LTAAPDTLCPSSKMAPGALSTAHLGDGPKRELAPRSSGLKHSRPSAAVAVRRADAPRPSTHRNPHPPPPPPPTIPHTPSASPSAVMSSERRAARTGDAGGLARGDSDSTPLARGERVSDPRGDTADKMGESGGETEGVPVGD
jgi:hypothetical protein